MNAVAVSQGADLLLSRLDGVQKSGKGARARCPSCGGKSRKVSITEGNNGALLVTCFSCHDTPAILAAIGLSLADLFPERLAPTTPEDRRATRRASLHADWDAALGVLVREATVVQCAVAYAKRCEVLTDDDQGRLDLAVERIVRAREVLHGRP